MKLPFISLLILFPLLAFAQLERKVVEEILPEELVLTLKSNSLLDVKKKFKDKIFKEDEEALYLSYYGKKSNDVTLGIKKQEINYLYIEVPLDSQDKIKELFNKAYNSLNPQEKSELKRKLDRSTSHDSGRFIIIDLPSRSMRLEFYNNEKKSLRSVLLWKEGEKRP